ncbi:hypothetical protein THIOM_004250 [Candidatus Thiomargarita nelsonii]|uniref:Antitoxin n=1 Tax=Candidatus Thiomargarita nelsonii TaxID=1003181 RepID=A0A176RWG6_9GAMM|nr:hypothetical protein THIOM_004250 [Candidatus Thiomargarita nelsonii]
MLKRKSIIFSRQLFLIGKQKRTIWRAKMLNKDYKLDTEEQDILDSFNRGEWVSKGEELEKYKKSAKQTFAKTHSVIFHLSEKDFRSMQVKAIEEGMSYQILLSSVVHKYLTSQLKMA